MVQKLIPAKIDVKYTFSIESMRARRVEVVRYISDKFLKPSTLIFTTASREILLSDRDEVGSRSSVLITA
jgi:hypothetical protein